MKIWLSSPCDGLLLTLTIQQADSELKDSLVRTAPKVVAFVADLAHNLKQFPGVGGLILPKSISPVSVLLVDSPYPVDGPLSLEGDSSAPCHWWKQAVSSALLL